MVARLRDAILYDTRANQPSAGDVDVGTLYFVSDEDVMERSNGSTWDQVGVNADPGDGGGTELDYTEFTSSVTVTATAEGSANTVVSAGAIAFDGSTKVKIEFFSPQVIPVSGSVSLILYLYDGSSSIGLLGAERFAGFGAVTASRILTPSNASHTYSVRATVGSGSGTVGAGAGGSGNLVPGYIRITNAA